MFSFVILNALEVRLFLFVPTGKLFFMFLSDNNSYIFLKIRQNSRKDCHILRKILVKNGNPAPAFGEQKCVNLFNV